MLTPPPFSFLALLLGKSWSGRRDSNSRPSPWQGDGRAVEYICVDAIFPNLARNLIPSGPVSSRLFPPGPVAVTHCVTHYHHDCGMLTTANTIPRQVARGPGSFFVRRPPVRLATQGGPLDRPILFNYVNSATVTSRGVRALTCCLRMGLSGLPRRVTPCQEGLAS